MTHVGSDNKFEVSSVLEMMTALAKKYAQQLLPFSSHINGISGTCFYLYSLMLIICFSFSNILIVLCYIGILDYLEGFTIENLHKVRIYLYNLLGVTIYCI